MAGASSDRLITCVADVATHVSTMSRLKTVVARKDSNLRSPDPETKRRIRSKSRLRELRIA